MVDEADLLRCPDGRMHDWQYGGKASKLYRCRRCPVQTSKRELKAATDA